MINYLQQANESRLSFLDKKEPILEEHIPCVQSQKEIFFCSHSSMSISLCGDKVWGIYLTQNSKNEDTCKLIMVDLKRKSELLYDYEHTFLA